MPLPSVPPSPQRIQTALLVGDIPRPILRVSSFPKPPTLSLIRAQQLLRHVVSDPLSFQQTPLLDFLPTSQPSFQTQPGFPPP